MLTQAGHCDILRNVEFGGEMKRWAVALRLLGMGWYIGICIPLGVLGGLWLDRTLHTQAPVICALLGLGLGILAAFLGVYRLLRLLMEDKGKENNNG